jgi:hypothetical protein
MHWLNGPFLTGLVALLLAGSPLCQDGAPEKLPVPEPAAQKEQEALIRKIFKDEYAKKELTDKQSLAKKLLQQAAETKDSPPSRFVLLREARDLAADGGDAETSIAAIDQMAADFKVAPFPMKSTALTAATKAVRNPEDQKRLATAFLKLTEDALAADEIEVATQAATRAVPVAKAAKDAVLAAKADAKSKELSELKGRAEGLRKAKETLATNPEDPAANAAMGEFLCLVKGDWVAGLPHLSKGPEGKLRDLARLDVSEPTVASEQVSLADAWWDLAEKDKGRSQDSLRRRAVFWYERALPNLSGIQQIKVNQRVSSGAPAWFSSGLFAHWKFDEGTGDVINDSSGNRHNGKIEGATWVKGQIGGALHFDGHLQRVILDAGDVPAPWTAAMWVRREAAPSHTARITDTVGYAKGTSLRLEQSINTKRVGFTKLQVADHAFDYSAPIDTWVHLAWVGAEKNVSLYANGVLVGAVDLFGPLSLERLGAHDDQSLKGSLDDFRVYTRALTAPEIQKLHQFGRR